MSNLNLDALKSTNTASSVGTGYDLTKQIRLEIDLFARESISILASLLEVKCINVSGATKITCCISRDAAGDDFVLTETQTDLQAGLTTTTTAKGLINLPVIIRDLNDKILYLHVKTNAGTVDIESALLTFRY